MKYAVLTILLWLAVYRSYHPPSHAIMCADDRGELLMTTAALAQARTIVRQLTVQEKLYQEIKANQNWT